MIFVGRARLAASLGVLALTATASVTTAGLTSASAAPAVSTPTLTGSAAAPLGTSPDVRVTYTATVTGGPLTDAVLTATEPLNLPMVDGSVLVDGAAAPLGTTDTSAGQLVVRGWCCSVPASSGGPGGTAPDADVCRGAQASRSGPSDV